MQRQRYLIECYRGSVAPQNREYVTKVRAMDTVQARIFGKMRRSGLIVEVTPIKERS